MRRCCRGARRFQLDSDRGQKLQDYGACGARGRVLPSSSENWRQASKKTAEYATLDLVQVVHEVRQVIFFGNAAIQLVGLTAAQCAAPSLN